MQLDAEARIERALHHSLAVHFEDSRRCEAAHQRLADLRRIGAGLAGEDQRLPEAARWGSLPAGLTLERGPALFPRLEG